MLGSWIIRTPEGSYYPRLREALLPWVGQRERADRQTIWSFARMDLLQQEPVAIAEASTLYERLRCLAPPSFRAWHCSGAIALLMAHLEIAVWDGRLDFQRLADPRELRGIKAQPTEPPFDVESPTKHWIELEIVDDETGEPMAGMRVSLTLPDGRSLETTTNADGIIHLDGQPDDAWTIVDVKEPVEVVAMAALSRE